MSVNGISNTNSNVAAQNNYYNNNNAKGNSSTENSNSNGNNAAAVYEPSSVNKKDNAAIVAQLKAETQARAQQMQDLVREMISKQGGTLGKANDIWRFLAKGNFTVDAKTAEEAKAAIADDGYWGVEKTSERIFEFAKALSGGDPDKMDKMLEAFKKGFNQATKAWGEKLPDISSRTYDAVLKRFDEYKTDNTGNASDK